MNQIVHELWNIKLTLENKEYLKEDAWQITNTKVIL